MSMAKKRSVWISEGMTLSKFTSFCRRKGFSENVLADIGERSGRVLDDD